MKANNSGACSTFAELNNQPPKEVPKHVRGLKVKSCSNKQLLPVPPTPGPGQPPTCVLFLKISVFQIFCITYIYCLL